MSFIRYVRMVMPYTVLGAAGATLVLKEWIVGIVFLVLAIVLFKSSDSLQTEIIELANEGDME